MTTYHFDKVHRAFRLVPIEGTSKTTVTYVHPCGIYSDRISNADATTIRENTLTITEEIFNDVKKLVEVNLLATKQQMKDICGGQ